MSCQRWVEPTERGGHLCDEVEPKLLLVQVGPRSEKVHLAWRRESNSLCGREVERKLFVASSGQNLWDTCASCFERWGQR